MAADSKPPMKIKSFRTPTLSKGWSMNAFYPSRSSYKGQTKPTTKLSQLNGAQAQYHSRQFSNDRTIVTKLIQKLLDLNATAQAKLLFAPPIHLTFSSTMFSLKALESPYESLCVYRSLCRKFPLKPDNFTYSFIIAAFYGFPSIACEKVGVLLHGLAIVYGYGSDLFVGSALVYMYTSFSWMEMAYKVFDGIPEPDTVLWSTMIYGLVEICCFYESLHVFLAMTGRTTHFTRLHLVVISGVAELQEIRTGMMVRRWL